jgi:phosphate transport system permease protein
VVKRKNKGDVIFRAGTLVFALIVPLIFLALFVSLSIGAWPALKKFGFGFIFSREWDPLGEIFGALPFIYGTLVSSFLALILAVPLGLGTAFYLSEAVTPSSFIKTVISRLVEMLAAIPSIIYGLWGIFVLGPFLANYLQPFLRQTLGFLPFFQGPSMGLGMMTAGIILAIMILPTITAISREVVDAVPNTLKEAALSLGTTKWETVKMAILGPAKSGIIGAIILGLGRAFGETMAVTMVIGNSQKISASLFAPAYTLASVIANEFAEATSDMSLAVLIELGLILLLLTVIINGLARLLVWKTAKKSTI